MSLPVRSGPRPNLLDHGQAVLVRRQKQAAGRGVYYARGAQVWSLTVWTGRQLFAREPTDVNGATVVHGEMDYLFSLSEEDADGLFPPREGDTITDPTITDPLTGQAKVFELRTPTGEPCWRWADEFHTTIRVHCQRLS